MARTATKRRLQQTGQKTNLHRGSRSGNWIVTHRKQLPAYGKVTQFIKSGPKYHHFTFVCEECRVEGLLKVQRYRGSKVIRLVACPMRCGAAYTLCINPKPELMRW